MLQAKVDKILHNIQALTRRNVPVSLLLDFGGHPWFDQSSATNHGAVHEATRIDAIAPCIIQEVLVVCPILVRQNITVPDDWDFCKVVRLRLCSLQDEIPIGGLGVSLQSRSPVNLKNITGVKQNV